MVFEETGTATREQIILGEKLTLAMSEVPDFVANTSVPIDCLSRNVYCVLGMPIDVIEMPSVLRQIEIAALRRAPFVISTCNLNFLVLSRSDRKFRESLLMSDLCSADGISIVWIARLVGVPIKSRIAGSDIFEALKTVRQHANPLKVYLFGAAEGVAAAACRALNAEAVALQCTGSFFPGYCSVEEMSRDDIIDSINLTGADILISSLGAKKGQLWFQHNHRRLSIPVRTHLGAVINFQAGTIRRAPTIIRRLGLEWLWRIKEEPYLWKRYWNDGRVVLGLVFTRVAPLALWTSWLRMRFKHDGEDLVVMKKHGRESVTLSLSGPATARHIEKAIGVFRDAISTKKQIIIDFSNVSAIDNRFFGLLLMLRKMLEDNANPILVGLSPRLKKIFRLNDLELLLPDQG
jgi:N-acetylglucosaminyldiphosphoundecaprenol N-acetyl-beta-D-mannosaminyltransferase